MKSGDMRFVLGCLALIWAGTAQAGLVDVGSQYTVNNVNFLDTYSESVTLDEISSQIDGGQISVTETITPDGPNSVWVEFSFTTVSGGPLATNLSDYWQAEINDIQFTTPVTLDAFFEYWDVDGTPFSGITNLLGNTVVAVNPITGSGEVYYGGGYNGPLQATQTLFTWLNPYDQLNAYGIDPSTANSWHIAGHFTAPVSGVPEPGTMTLAGLGAFGLVAAALRRRRSPKMAA